LANAARCEPPSSAAVLFAASLRSVGARSLVGRGEWPVGEPLVDMNETGPTRGSHPDMTHTPDPRHAVHHSARGATAPRAGPGLPAEAGQRLDGDSALDLLIAHTGPGQTVLDFDHDPILRAAAHATGRRYRTPSAAARHATAVAVAEEPPADLITVTWPRAPLPAPASGHAVLAAAVAALTPQGQVAILLEPTIPQAYTVTWTGALLAAARQCGLDYLQDVVCLHATPGDIGRHATPAAAPTLGGRPSAPVTGVRHRVVLILRREGGRHV
jgi:hypothetical protein